MENRVEGHTFRQFKFRHFRRGSLSTFSQQGLWNKAALFLLIILNMFMKQIAEIKVALAPFNTASKSCRYWFELCSDLPPLAQCFLTFSCIDYSWIMWTQTVRAKWTQPSRSQPMYCLTLPLLLLFKSHIVSLEIARKRSRINSWYHCRWWSKDCFRIRQDEDQPHLANG